MPEFKIKFRVASKGFKENEKGEGAEKEITRLYHAYLMDDDTGYKINLHSNVPIPLKVGDELELRAVAFQKALKAEE
jgi:hypothetical protein